MRRPLFPRSLFCTLLALTLIPAAAQAAGGKVTGMMTALDPVTLQGQGAIYRLWGVRPVTSPAMELKALDLIDRLIGNAPVTCQPTEGQPADSQATHDLARCSTGNGEDLGLALLNHGYAVIDRHQDVSAVPAYAEAQIAARHNAAGIWRAVVAPPQALPKSVQMLLNVLPVAAVLLMILVLHYRLKRLETQQQEEYEQARNKENRLLVRERHVLATTLEGELTGNKNRIEAFLTIYGEMLENLKNTAETPKYKQSGDIVQRRPVLSKAVFESSVGKLSLLDIKLAARLSKLYATLPVEQEYVNIEQAVPLESAIALVEKVIQEAEALCQPIEEAVKALETVMAGSRTDAA